MNLSPKVAAYKAACESAGAVVSVEGASLRATSLRTGRAFVVECSAVENLRNPSERARLDLTMLDAAAPEHEQRRQPRKAGKAWAELLMKTRASDHGSQLFVDAYDAGRADAAAIVLDAPQDHGGRVDPDALYREIAP